MDPSFFQPVGKPTTGLGRYRQLASRAGVFVSPISLGGMSIGDKWDQFGMGEMDKESSFKLLDAYFDAGGNFIDTANMYQDGTSEEFIGEWAEKRGIRDQLVIATKYTNNLHRGNVSFTQHVNFVGNSAKSLKISADASFKRLRTDYIDILYVHFWDLHTSVEEIMDSLHNLVAAGKVLYLGITDSPAWFVTAANAYARAAHKTPFVVYQAAYSVLYRDVERDIMPMCRFEGMALTFWNVLAAGKIRTDAEEERRRQSGEGGRTTFSPNWERTEDERKVCKALEEVAGQVGAKSITSVAIAYTMSKAPYTFPIIGGRKVEHLKANLETLEISLSDEQVAYIDGILPFDLGFPQNIFGVYGQSGYFPYVGSFGPIDAQPHTGPIKGRPL